MKYYILSQNSVVAFRPADKAAAGLNIRITSNNLEDSVTVKLFRGNPPAQEKAVTKEDFDSALNPILDSMGQQERATLNDLIGIV